MAAIVSKMRRFTGLSFHDKLNTIRTLMFRIKSIIYYRHIFGTFGAGSILFKPMLLSNPKFIHIGRNVGIREGARIEIIHTSRERTPSIVIGENVMIEQGVHIVSHCRVVICKDVGIAPRCVIMDTAHPFFDVHDPVPIRQRLSISDSFVEIGEGSLIGAGTFIMPNVRIGKHVVIGANSVVRKSIPDYSVASGNPATVQLKYDPNEQAWKAVNKA